LKDIKAKLSLKYHKFLDVFDWVQLNKLFFHHFYDHKIELINDSTFSYFWVYWMFFVKLLKVKKYLNENLLKKFITSSLSVIHTFLWHRFRLDSWETLCYLYRVNKTLWERKSLVVYTTASRSRNNKIDTVLSSNESIASIQRVMLE